MNSPPAALIILDAWPSGLLYFGDACGEWQRHEIAREFEIARACITVDDGRYSQRQAAALLVNVSHGLTARVLTATDEVARVARRAAWNIPEALDGIAPSRWFDAHRDA